jgi:hypothetical protein
MDPQSPPTPRDPSMNSPPPPKAKKNAKAWVPPLPPPKAKKNPAKKKEKSPRPKLAYEITQEELNEHVRKEVREQFALRKLEPKQPVDPAGQKFFITMCQLSKKETLSDYNHSITKSYQRRVIVGAKTFPSSKNNPNNRYLHSKCFQKRMKLRPSLWQKRNSQKLN